MAAKQFILFPAGRVVQGSLYEGQDTDADGNPLKVKSGVNVGQARVSYYFAVAIPKAPGQQWWDTDWGKQILAIGYAAFPQAAQSPTFAWKVTDGDSTIPNTKGKRPCDNEGYPGNWVVRFASGYEPKIVSADGTEKLTTPDLVKPGYFVQVYASCDGNGSTQRPGIYLNHVAVAFLGYGPEIVYGPDLSSVGFGKGVTLPPGASTTPPAMTAPGAAMQPPAAPMAPGMPHPGMAMAPGMAPQAPVAGYGTPAMSPGMPAAAAPMVPVTPHTAILQPPGMPAAPGVPVAPVVRQMTAKAGGHSYEALIGGGWTDDTLRQNGLML